MAKYDVSHELWAYIEPLLSVQVPRSRWPGRLPLDDRACLNGMLFVLLTGSLGRPAQQLGYGSGITCWRRLRDWSQAGAWDRLHALLLAKLPAAVQIDCTQAHGRLAPRGSGAAAPQGALRAIDHAARPRSWRSAPPAAAISAD